MQAERLVTHIPKTITVGVDGGASIHVGFAAAEVRFPAASRRGSVGHLEKVDAARSVERVSREQQEYTLELRGGRNS